MERRAPIRSSRPNKHIRKHALLDKQKVHGCFLDSRSAIVARRAHIANERSTDMDPFLLLGGLAVFIGIIGVIVLLRGRKKNIR